MKKHLKKWKYKLELQHQPKKQIRKLLEMRRLGENKKAKAIVKTYLQNRKIKDLETE